MGGAPEHEEPTRCAEDGKRYTFEEFREYYRWPAVVEAAWEEAGQREEQARAPPAQPQDPQAVAAPALSAAPSALAAAQPQASEAAASAQQNAEAAVDGARAGAAEHGELMPRRCLLNEEDLQTVRAQTAALPRSASGLHAEARALLNELAEGEEAASVDLQQRWPTWRQYLALHSKGNEIVGPGVVAITAERIAGTSDPNRYGRKRLDFFVHRMDGSAYRLHPGTTRAQDAKPVYISPMVLQSTHGDPAVLRNTLAELQAIPQSDRYGKMHAFNKLLELKCELGDDLTDRQKFAWPLFFANLGRLFQQVVGQRVAKVRLMQQHEEKITLEVTNSEGVVQLHLQRYEGRHGMEVQISIE